MTVGINHFIFTGTILLGLGIYISVSNRNFIKVLMGISMIFLASILNFAAFSNFSAFNTEGQFIIFMISAVVVLILAYGIILKHNFDKAEVTESNQNE